MAQPIFPVILAGGSGTRLWPLSRQDYPKQFLPLAGDLTMLQATVRRAHHIADRKPMIVGQYDHRFIIAEQIAEAGLGPVDLVLEPMGRNTAIAIAVAAELAMKQHPNAVLWVMPADHVIANEAALSAAVDVAESAAAEGKLVTFGITPQYAATGYGYIARAESLPKTPHAYGVRHFVEKPNVELAAEYMQSGEWLWNSGMFLMRADIYLAELHQHEPKIAAAAHEAVEHAQTEQNNMIRLATSSYAHCPSRSIDHAVMEHTSHAAVVPCDCGWSDVGSWGSLWDIGDKDANGNIVQGDAIAHASENCYVRSEGPLVATCGIKDVVVVATEDAVLISSREQQQEIKFLLAEMMEQGRKELAAHTLTHRPWGSYQVIAEGPGFKVKRIMVKPGKRLSLQSHQYRSEHWTVVRGVGMAEVMQENETLKPNEMLPNTSIYIPLGAVHRLTNPGEEMLEIIEVQCGDILVEEDIERYSDDFGRSSEERRAA